MGSDQINVDTAETSGWVQLLGVANFDNTDAGLSHIAAVEAVLRFRGVDVNRDWLMGVSGEAFGFYYHPDGTFLSRFVHSWDSAGAALTTYGYRGQWHHDAGADIGPSLEIVRREIGAGRAVIAPGIHPSPDGVHSLCNYWFVVTGVDVDAGRVQLVGAADAGAFALARGDDGRAEYHPRWYGICRTFDGMAGHYGPAGADNPLLTVEPSGVTPVPNTTVREALTRAVALAHEEEATASTGWGDGVYLSGIGAMEQLRNDVLAAQGDGPDEFNRLNPPKGDPFRGLGDELEHLHLLAQRRHAAAAFCRRAAGLLPDAASLADAADAYEQVADGAEQAFALRYGSTEQLTAVFALIDTVEDLDGDPRWSAYWQRADAALADPHVRERIGGHLTHVIEHEHSAITQIEAALTTRQ